MRRRACHQITGEMIVMTIIIGLTYTSHDLGVGALDLTAEA